MARETINGISVPVPNTGEPAAFQADLRRIAADLSSAVARSAFKVVDLPVVAHDGNQTTVEIIDPDGAGDFGLTWTANPDIAFWRGTFYVVFDGNRDGGTDEAEAGQKCQLLTSTDGVTWVDGGEVFSEAASCTNPIASDGHFQPNLLAPEGDDGPLLCFWQNADSAFIATLSTPTGKWTNKRVEFIADTIQPVLSTTVSGAAAGGRELTARIGAVIDYRPFFPARPIVLEDGTIAAALTMQSLTVNGTDAAVSDGAFFRRLKFNVVWYSTDGGDTWEHSDPIQPGASSWWEASWEPFLVERRDGALQLFSRNTKQSLILTSSQTLLQAAQLQAVSYNRRTFTIPTPTKMVTTTSRVQAVQQSTSRWLACMNDNPLRINAALFASRTGRDDFVAGPQVGDDEASVSYPQTLIVGTTGYVIHNADRRGRRALRLTTVDLDLDEDTAYVYPRRPSAGHAAAPALLSAPSRWRFSGASKVTPPAVFSQSAFTSCAWLRFDDESARVLADFRQPATADDSGFLVLRTDGVSVGTLLLQHGLTFDYDAPTLVALRANASTGRLRVSVLGSTDTDLTDTYECYVKTLGITGTPADGETVVVGANTYTFRTAPSLTRDVQISGSNTSLANLATKIAADGLSVATLTRATTNRLAIAKTDGTTFTLTGSATVPAVDTPLTSGTTAPVLGFKASASSSLFPLIADVHEWKLFSSELSDGEVKGVYNARAAAFGFVAMTGASAVPAAAQTFDETTTSATWPSLGALPPRSEIDGTDLVIYGEASASIELPFERTVVQLTYALDEVPTSSHRYVIATFGTPAAPIYLYADAADPYRLYLGNGSTGPGAAQDTGLAVRRPAEDFRVEVLVTEYSVIVGSATKPIDSRRMHLGHAYPDGITVLATPDESIRYDLADMKVSDAKFGIRTAGVKDDVTIHAARTDNPHAVTKAQVGLGNVDNTSDTDKPVSTATAAAIAAGDRANAYTSGQWYLPEPDNGSSTTAAPGNGSLRVRPILIRKAVTISHLSVAITSAGSAGCTMRLAVYDDDDGYPGDLIGEVSVAADAVAAPAGALAATLPPGVYWVGAALQGAPASQPTIVTSNPGSPLPQRLGTSAPTGSGSGGLLAAGQTGAFPATFPAGAALTGTHPRVVFKVA